MEEARILNNVRILIEHHPKGQFVGIAYLMWTPPVTGKVGYPTFVEVQGDSILDVFAHLDGKLGSFDYGLFNHRPVDCTVEHSFVSEEDLQTIKTVTNG